MPSFLIQPVSGECCISPCARSGPCEPCENWAGCDGSEPATIEFTITSQPSGIPDTETYTKNADFCRYDNLNPGGGGQHITWSNSLSKWRYLNGTFAWASNDLLLGEYTTLSGSDDFSVAL